MKKTADLTPQDERLIEEMYKARYSITETSQLTGFGRHVIVRQYNLCKTRQVPQHSRATLLARDILPAFRRYQKEVIRARERIRRDIARDRSVMKEVAA